MSLLKKKKKRRKFTTTTKTESAAAASKIIRLRGKRERVRKSFSKNQSGKHRWVSSDMEVSGGCIPATMHLQQKGLFPGSTHLQWVRHINATQRTFFVLAVSEVHMPLYCPM